MERKQGYYWVQYKSHPMEWVPGFYRESNKTWEVPGNELDFYDRDFMAIGDPIECKRETAVYNIIEARIEYQNKKLQRVTVLVEISEGDIRAISSTIGFQPGYDYLQPDEPVNDALLQRVAGYGMEIIDKKSIFPNWNKKLKTNG